jgi:hypothetical protein
VPIHHLIAEYKLSVRASDGQRKSFNIAAIPPSSEHN